MAREIFAFDGIALKWQDRFLSHSAEFHVIW